MPAHRVRAGGFFAAAGEKFLFPLFTAAREKVYNTKY